MDIDTLVKDSIEVGSINILVEYSSACSILLSSALAIARLSLILFSPLIQASRPTGGESRSPCCGKQLHHFWNNLDSQSCGKDPTGRGQ